ncbi:hypothetical protein NUW54_g5466 [Trametes sanguinea]|uniref:Uncharacterized protein n=1 Tax=Trametes sanguinea TaxID=158606 RepID=A0ACC1PVJ5_9APHY|nr:hypothetical protein NUW54_g5466 [Trametes sanguinea]
MLEPYSNLRSSSFAQPEPGLVPVYETSTAVKTENPFSSAFYLPNFPSAGTAGSESDHTKLSHKPIIPRSQIRAPFPRPPPSRPSRAFFPSTTLPCPQTTPRPPPPPPPLVEGTTFAETRKTQSMTLLTLARSSSREAEAKSRAQSAVGAITARQLKIRCDKTIPCQSCQRRGCAALCPNGSLATGQGTRFVLAATEHLHRRIAKMSERIHQLEDALAITQAKCSNDPHPLLSDGKMQVRGLEEDDETPLEDMGTVTPTDVVSAFGMLSVSDHGVSRFFGPTGGTEYLLFSDNDGPPSPSNGSRSPESIRGSKTPPLPGEIARFSSSFPFTPMGPPQAVYDLILSHLPLVRPRVSARLSHNRPYTRPDRNGGYLHHRHGGYGRRHDQYPKTQRRSGGRPSRSRHTPPAVERTLTVGREAILEDILRVLTRPTRRDEFVDVEK